MNKWYEKYVEKWDVTLIDFQFGQIGTKRDKMSQYEYITDLKKSQMSKAYFNI